MKFIEYTFREFIDSDFWNTFSKINRDGFEYIQCPESRIVLGVRSSTGEKFDDLISFYYNFGKGEWDSPKYIKVAEYSDQQALEDLSASIVDVHGSLFIMIPEVKCKRPYPGYPQGFFLPLTGNGYPS